MYTRFLANSYISPATRNNYLSGARSWIAHHCGNIASFNSPEVAAILKKCSKDSQHVPTQAPPLTPSLLRLICKFLDISPSVPLSVKPALLLAYFCFLRASNVVSPSLQTWGGPHTLRVSDIIITPQLLSVYIRSTKMFAAPIPVVIHIRPSSDESVCPLQAWLKYITIVRPCPSGPAFLLDNGQPLTTKPVVQLMRLALASHHVPNA